MAAFPVEVHPKYQAVAAHVELDVLDLPDPQAETAVQDKMAIEDKTGSQAQMPKPDNNPLPTISASIVHQDPLDQWEELDKKAPRDNLEIQEAHPTLVMDPLQAHQDPQVPPARTAIQEVPANLVHPDKYRMSQEAKAPQVPQDHLGRTGNQVNQAVQDRLSQDHPVHREIKEHQGHPEIMVNQEESVNLEGTATQAAALIVLLRELDQDTKQCIHVDLKRVCQSSGISFVCCVFSLFHLIVSIRRSSK